MEGNILLKERTQTINNKIKLHILEVPMNKLGNWLIGGVSTILAPFKNVTNYLLPQSINQHTVRIKLQ